MLEAVSTCGGARSTPAALLPLRDGTAGQSSYGGARYALDTAKGADLGGRDGAGVDLKLLYHPS